MTDSEPPPPLPTPTPTPRRTSSPRAEINRRQRNFKIGRVISTTFSVWFSNLASFVVLSVIVFSPYIALVVWANLGEAGILDELWWSGADFLLQWFFQLVVTAAVVYGVFQQLRKRAVPFDKAVSVGLSRLPSVLAVAALVFGVYILCAIPMGIVLVVQLAGTDGYVGPEKAASALGLGFWISGPLFAIATCGLFLAVPASVVERPGISGALRRSWQLTRGLKWRIFLMMIVFGLLNMIVAVVLGGILGAVLGFDRVLEGLGGASYRGEWAFQMVINVVFVSLQAVLSAVTYHEVRTAVEGVDTEQLAAIFD